VVSRNNARQAPVGYYPSSSVPSLRGEKGKVRFSFMMPEALANYVQEIRKARRKSLVTVLVDHVSIARDILEEATALGRIMEFEADRRGISFGTLVGQLAFEKLREMYPDITSAPPKKK
jgi:hypothetical protein